MRGAPSGSLERKVSRPRLRGCVADTNMVKFSSGGLKRPWCTNDVGPQVNWTFGTSLPLVQRKPPTSPPMEQKGPPPRCCQRAMFSGVASCNRSVESFVAQTMGVMV